MNERTLEDFFNDCEDNKKPKKKEKVKKEKLHFKSIKEFFRAKFSFDAFTDLTNPVSVLFRKNQVIANIITVSNWLFIIFSFVGISKSNFIVTVAFFLLVTGLSFTIKKMLEIKTDDMHHQQLIMYLQSAFIFVKTIVLYIKTYLGFVNVGVTSSLSLGEFSITQAAYFLVFYSVVIVSLYQDTTLLKHSYLWMFLILTVINITLLHPELYLHAESAKALFEYCFKGEGTNILVDIILRTFVIIIFFSALFVSTSITKNQNEKRKDDFNKRVDVEKNFKDVVNSVFTACKAYNLDLDPISSEIESRKASAVSMELGKAFNLDSLTLAEIKDKSEIHYSWIKELNLDDINEINESNFNEINARCELARRIMIRLEINKRCEDIVYHVFNSDVSSEFIERVKPYRVDIVSNIIMLSIIYIILRSDRSYKRALNHQRSLEMIIDNMNDFFMNDVILRFKKFNSEINNAYELN